MIVGLVLSAIAFWAVGCADDGHDDSVATTQEPDVNAQVDAGEEPTDEPPTIDESMGGDQAALFEADDDPAHSDDDELPDEPASVEPEHEEAQERELSDAEAEIAHHFVGVWLVEGERHSNSTFIFTPDGRAQAGNEALMFGGEYTLDFDHEMPYLYVQLDVMGRTVEQKSFVEYVHEDMFRLFTVQEDPDAPGEYVKVQPERVMVLTRDE